MNETKHIAPEVLQLSHLFACQNKVILLSSDNDEPLQSFAQLDHSGKTIILFSSELDANISFPSVDVAIIKVRTWIQLGIFLKRIQFPVDYLVLDRVDLWDLARSKKDRGRIRKPILAQLVPRKLKGTNVIITTMGNDVGLEEQADETIRV